MHDVLNATPASLSPKPALSPSLSIVASLLPLTHIPILRSPTPGYFLSHIKYTRLGTSYNGFRERLHRNAREIDRRAGCSFGMSVETTPCHFDECPSGFQSLMYKNIYNTCTSLSAIAHSLLPSLKVTKMSEAFVSKDVYEIYDMMEHIADHLGVKTQQLTRNLSPDAFCLVQSENDLYANTDRAMAARGSFNGLPYELQSFICDHLNDTKNSFSEILTELTPSPVSFSLYYDSPGVLRLAQIDSSLITPHSTVTHFNSAFVAPVHTDPSVTIATIYGTQRACKQYLRSYFKFLADFGMKQSSIEPCLWYRVDSESEFIFIGVYSDDNLIVSKGSLRASFQDHFNAHYDDPHPIPLNWVHSVKRYASDDSCNRHKARLCYA